MKDWLKLAPPINRLALGAIFNGKISDPADAYRRLSDFLPFQIDADSSDFQLQTNKKIPSKVVDGLAINRLTKWEVRISQLFVFPITAAAGSPIVQSPQKFTACRLELDVNSEAERIESLPNDSLSDLWQEFADLALAIADEGIKSW